MEGTWVESKMVLCCLVKYKVLIGIWNQQVKIAMEKSLQAIFFQKVFFQFKTEYGLFTVHIQTI